MLCIPSCLLLHHRYHRINASVFGKLSVNLQKCPASSSDSLIPFLYHELQNLIPNSHFISLSRENLSKSKFVPKKNFDSNKLVSGILQLSPGTHLFIDETAMTQGVMDSQALSNLQQLASAIHHQTVKYDFTYNQVDIPTDLPSIIVSEGKSMFANAVWKKILLNIDVVRLVVAIAIGPNSANCTLVCN